jgi:hypothetical protein
MLAGARRLPLGRSAEQPQEPDWQSVFADAASPEQLAALVCRLHRETSADGPLAALRQPGAAAADGGSLAARLVEALGEGSAERFGDLWLQLLPAAAPMRSGGCTLRLLGSMRDVLRCGRVLHNCARHPETVLAYLVSLRCLVAIEDDGRRPIGLMAVLLERSGDDLLLQASQALGPRNGPLPAGAAGAAEKFVDDLAAEPARFENFVRVEDENPVASRVIEEKIECSLLISWIFRTDESGSMAPGDILSAILRPCIENDDFIHKSSGTFDTGTYESRFIESHYRE